MGRITASRKQLKPDAKHGSLLAAKFVNCLMWDGKKSIAYKVFYDSLDIIQKRISDQEPIEVFHQAVGHEVELHALGERDARAGRDQQHGRPDPDPPAKGRLHGREHSSVALPGARLV